MKLYFRCKYKGCHAVFSKSCNLRDHFRKHTSDRPFKCEICAKTFTQSGNLGRHYKNLHKIDRRVAKVTPVNHPFKIDKTGSKLNALSRSPCSSSDPDNNSVS